MTMRDPDARYQTPQEVVDALAPNCEELSMAVFRTAARHTSSDSGASPLPDPNIENDDQAHEEDGTYRKFLKEVEEGSVVDLMLATDSDLSSSMSTAPVVQLDITSDIRSTASQRKKSNANSRQKPRRGQKTGFIAMGVGALILSALAIIAFYNGSDKANKAAVAPVVQPKSVAPVASFQKATLTTATVGETWTHDLKADVTTEPADGNLQFAVGDTAPVGLIVDPKSGRMEWAVPMEQPPSNYSIPVQLIHVVGDTEELLAEATVPVDVVLNISNAKLSEPRRSETLAMVERPFELPMTVEGVDGDALELKYELRGRTPNGLKLDSSNSMLTWTPTTEQMGPHQVTVSVSDAENSKELSTRRVMLLVLPSEVGHVLPPIPPQTAIAGRQFRYTLPKSGFKRDDRAKISRVIEAGPDAPKGLRLTPDNTEIRWSVPDDFTGSVRFSLLGRLSGPGASSRSLAGAVPMEIEVSAASTESATEGMKSPPSSMPAADEITKAVAELRTTYARRIARARTTVDKAMLASHLLLQVRDSEPGVTDAAALQLIDEDLAAKARAIDVQLEIAQLRAERYGTDELAEVSEIFESFRRTGLSQRQQDSIIEHGLRLAVSSTTAGQYVLSSGILDVVKSLLKREASGAAGVLYSDVSSANDIAVELSRATEGTVDDLSVKELLRLLNRWQFRPIFQEASSKVFVQAAMPQRIPLEGRDLWTIKDGQLLLTSEQQSTLVGFVDTTEQRDRYVLRFQLMPESNSTQIIFAASGGTSNVFTAHTIVLHAGAMGRISALNNNVPLNDLDVFRQAQLLQDMPNDIEVVVDGPAIAVRLNGTLMSTATIPELSVGWLGIAADLRRPEPRLHIRNPRLLVMPGNL